MPVLCFFQNPVELARMKLRFKSLVVLGFRCWLAVAAPQPLELFNGNDWSGWKSSQSGGPVGWKIGSGFFEVVPGTGDIETEAVFNDFDLHAEFWVPFLPEKTGQDRGNSGIFLQGRYEVQILDSWNSESYLEGMCGALYKLIPPLVNMSLPPEQWQTYDIQFKAPRLDEKEAVVTPGEITVIHNGRVIIDRGLFERGTGSAAKKKQGIPGPLRLQDHGSAVRFRNLVLNPRDFR